MSTKTISKIRPTQIRDRRHRRTTDVLEALQLQLDACRQDAAMTAMVVADEHGMCLAAAGSPPLCSEIAARLPILSRKAGDFTGVLLDGRGTVAGVAVALRRFEIDGSELYACAVGGDKQRHAAELERATTGVRRILAA